MLHAAQHLCLQTDGIRFSRRAWAACGFHACSLSRPIPVGACICVRSCMRLGYDRTVPAGAMALAVSDSGAPLLQPEGDIRAGTRAFMRCVGWVLGIASFARCTLSVAFRLVHARCRALHRYLPVA